MFGDLLFFSEAVNRVSHVLLLKPGLLLVTTPFSLVRLLSCHCFLFLRMYHLVLDEADQLFTRAPDQVTVSVEAFVNDMIY